MNTRSLAKSLAAVPNSTAAVVGTLLLAIPSAAPAQWEREQVADLVFAAEELRGGSSATPPAQSHAAAGHGAVIPGGCVSYREALRPGIPATSRE